MPPKHNWLRITLLIILAASIIYSVSYGALDLFKGAFFVDKRLAALKEAGEMRKVGDAKDEKSQVKYVDVNCDVLVVGGGASGISAAIQASRGGAKTCLTEETDWLGGMMTSAGVSSLDGNSWNYTGLLKEFFDRVESKYAQSPEETHKCFAPFCYEPHVGSIVFKEMAAKEKNLTVFLKTQIQSVLKEGKRITGVIAKNKANQTLRFNAKITVEASEWGDLLYLADVPFDLGVDSESGEPDAGSGTDCLQPITYVALVRDAGQKVPSVEKPADYDQKNYECVMPNKLCPKSTTQFEDFNFFKGYGQFPYGKIMVNVPSHSWGNDFNHAASQYDSFERTEITQKAKNYTLGLVYFMQTVLGKNTYELVKDEFGTEDGLAKIPYGRESRRGRGLVRVTEQDILPDAATGSSKFWPDSIAVGDYFLDLHRCSPGAPDIFTYIPPFQVPYRALVPQTTLGLLFAEKNISVTHIANGATRLQPIVMSIGQAAGAAAGLAVKNNVEPKDVDVLELQKTLVEAGLRVNFYEDVKPKDNTFSPISLLTQKGVVKGYGKNQFGVDRPVTRGELASMIFKNFGEPDNAIKATPYKFKDVKSGDWFSEYAYGLPAGLSGFFAGNKFEPNKPLTRGETANWLNVALKLDQIALQKQGGAPIGFDDLPKNYKFRFDIETLSKLGIFKGSAGKVRPGDTLKRSEAAVVIYRVEDIM